MEIRKDIFLLLAITLAVVLNQVCGKMEQQRFRVLPENTQVILGKDITLRCRVDHQRGLTQWTRSGFALGFDRLIPGHPRYTMVGNEDDGVHDLLIQNVSLADDGNFECQVTPMAPSQGIRHEIRFTVLVPPISIEMIGQAQNSKKTVKAGDAHTMECLAKLAKPAPSILWFRGSEQLVLDNQVNTPEDSDEPKLKNMRSRLTITPTSLDNGIKYSCRTSHPALTGDEELSFTIALNVQYAPGPPEISGYEDGDTLTAGENKTLICKSRGGNPLPEVIWFKNGLQIHTKFVKHRSYTVNAYEFTVDSSDNGATYECHVHNIMTTHPKKAHVKVKVNFQPSMIRITSPQEVRVGDVISITCEAINSNPVADVSLVINQQTTSGLVTDVNTTSQGGYTTTATLSGFHIVETDSDLNVNCYAVNAAIGRTKVNTTVIRVLRPPPQPLISGYVRGKILTKGQPVTLICRSEGGNPLPDLKWYKGYTLVTESTTKSDGASVAKLTRNVDETDNGAEYRCEATNMATKFPLVASTVMTVTYNPLNVNISVSPSTPLAGENMVLTCITTPAFPRANNIKWTRNRLQVQGEYGPEMNGTYLGVITMYSINVTASKEDNNIVYACQAGNSSLGPIANDAVTLNVRYAPVNLRVTGNTSVTVGDNVVIQATGEGNPSPLKYTWRRGSNFVMDGSTLNITRVDKDLAGTYTLEVSNQVGSAFMNVSIVITFAPMITKGVGAEDIRSGADANLECNFVGSPIPDITWSRKGYKMDKTLITSPTVGKSILTVKNASASDTGIFTCTAKNNLGSASLSNISLVVNQKPEVVISPQYQKAAAELGQTARLVCRIKAWPKPTFTWYTETQEPISSDIHPRYNVQPVKLVDKLNTHESVLEVTEVTAKDHSTFKCQAWNQLGMISSQIQLEGTTRPDPPINLQVLNVSHDAVKLAWVPGFDGGTNQSFIIRYYLLKDSNMKQSVEVFPANSTQFWVFKLDLGSKYNFKVAGRNSKGLGVYSQAVETTTLSDPPPTPSRPPGTTDPISSLAIILITLVGAAFLILNVALITCFIKRTAKKRLTASSDKGSSKSTNIEMYAPSSYTGTVTGETLSSISEKSRESYAQEDSADDYEDGGRIAATSTYLIEQLDPPLQYASRPPPHILPPPSSHNDLCADETQDRNRMRNQFNVSLDHVPGYGTLGRRGTAPPPSDPYTVGNGDPYSLAATRYNTYLPPSSAHHHQVPLPGTQVRPHPHMHPHPHVHYDGSLKRNPAPKLHFPKDYIRNGSTSNVGDRGTPHHEPTYSRGPSNSATMGSPTSANPPVLSSFAPDLTGTNSVPLEQRGHLV